MASRLETLNNTRDPFLSKPRVPRILGLCDSAEVFLQAAAAKCICGSIVRRQPAFKLPVNLLHEPVDATGAKNNRPVDLGISNWDPKTDPQT